MKIVFSSQAWEDYLYWQQTDRKKLSRVNDLIKEIVRSPFTGMGKPEPLRHALTGFWSRRIDDEHCWFTKSRMMPYSSRKRDIIIDAQKCN